MNNPIEYISSLEFKYSDNETISSIEYNPGKIWRSEVLKPESQTMTPLNFCYWLQGFLEIAKPNEITPTQVQEIQNHLNLVFKKVTPNISEPTQFPNFPNPVLSEPYCSPSVIYKHDGPIHPTIEVNYLNDPPGSC